MRIPFLNAVFPDALFIFLYRNPRNNISSIIDAWRSGKFVTYPKLPGWGGAPWSMLLPTGWRDLSSAPVEQIAAFQWKTTNLQILDDLDELSPDKWCVVSYEDFLTARERQLRRLCDFAGVPFGQRMQAVGTGELPLSRHTLTPPDPEKWRRNQKELGRVLDKEVQELTVISQSSTTTMAKSSSMSVSPIGMADPFERPVFIVSAPRSGSTLLFEALANNRNFWTLGGEGHAEIEDIPHEQEEIGWPHYRKVIDETLTRASQIPGELKIASNGLSALYILRNWLAAALNPGVTPRQSSTTTMAKSSSSSWKVLTIPTVSGYVPSKNCCFHFDTTGAHFGLYTNRKKSAGHTTGK